MTAWREPIKVLADVLKGELELDDNHVVLTNEKWPIPPDETLFLALSILNGKPIGNNNYLDPTIAGANEVQQVAMQDLVQIDAMSFNGEARSRREDILMALASHRCQRAQAEYQFQIARIPQGFANASNLEETKQINRFTTTLIIKSIKTKVKAAEYYDTFQPTEVHPNV